MGGDGGSIATRADMVKTKGYRFLRNLGGMGYVPNTQVREGDERLRRSEARDLQLSTCSLSQEPLRLPIVACRLGRLYNKEELLSRLLSKSMPPHMQHVSSLKDVQECVTEINKETHFLVCPISRVDIRSGIKASIIWPCGCIVSDKARRAAATAAATAASKNKTSSSSSTASGQQKTQDAREPEIQGAATTSTEGSSSDGRVACVNCGRLYDPVEDLIPLLPEDEELEKLQGKVKRLLDAKHAAKQAKKARTTNTATDVAATASTTNSSTNCSASDSSSKDIVNSNGTTSSCSASKSCSSSSVSEKVGSSRPAVPHPAAVAPCATSTRLQAGSFAWPRKEEEKEQKRKQRDWVLSSGYAVDKITGTLKLPRDVKRCGVAPH